MQSSKKIMFTYQPISQLIPCRTLLLGFSCKTPHDLPPCSHTRSHFFVTHTCYELSSVFLLKSGLNYGMVNWCIFVFSSIQWSLPKTSLATQGISMKHHFFSLFNISKNPPLSSHPSLKKRI